MKKTKISGYPSLTKYPLKEQFDYVVPSGKMIELLKEYIPTTCQIGTIWNKERVEEFKETEILTERCRELRKLILEFDFMGSIAFKLNNEIVLVRIFFDEEDERKTIEFSEAYFFQYEYEFN